MAKTQSDQYVETQVARQYDERAYLGKRTLDFDPFLTSLERWPEARRAVVDELLRSATIPETQRALASGALSAEELVLLSVWRIQTHDVDRLNAVIELNPDALILARDLDEERRRGAVRGTLHGIPVLLKDNIATGDRMHNTAGAAALRDAYADRDAFITQRLRAAGAVILGKANLSEWANFMTSDSANGFSVLGGQTRNPYGRFDVGGSSSGSAVAVAANLVTVSVGTETAGSLVYPASQNAVVTLKPSLGLLSRDRIIPITGAMDTAGPMARTVADLAILLNALTGVDPNDPVTAQARSLAGVDFTTYLRPDGLQGMRIGAPADFGSPRTGDDAVRQRVLAVLRRAGAEIAPIELAAPEIDFKPVLAYGLREGVNAYLAAMGERTPVKSLAEIIAFNAADPANRAPFGQDLLELAQASELTPAAYTALVEDNRCAGAEALRAALQENQVDFLLSLSNGLTRLYATAGFPAITVPAGHRDNGEPIGLTLVGDYLDDGRLIAAAYAYEQAKADLKTGYGSHGFD